MRDLLTTAGPFALLAALLLGLARLVLDPKPPRHLVLAIGHTRSDVAEFGARTSSRCAQWGLPTRGQSAAKGQQVGTNRAPLGVQILAQQGIDWIPPGLIVGLRATNSEESTTGVGQSLPTADVGYPVAQLGGHPFPAVRSLTLLSLADPMLSLQRVA